MTRPTLRQQLLQWIYPLSMIYGRFRRHLNFKAFNVHHTLPNMDFHTLEARLSDGNVYHFEKLKGKKVVIVNVASHCGYSSQYDDLEELFQRHKDNLVVLAFPCNDFGSQEPSSSEQVHNYCRVNYGVSFPIMEKCSILGQNVHPVFKWLSSIDLNGWNHQKPGWNFYKYLIDEKGSLVAVMGTTSSPLHYKIHKWIIDGKNH